MGRPSPAPACGVPWGKEMLASTSLLPDKAAGLNPAGLCGPPSPSWRSLSLTQAVTGHLCASSREDL